MKLICSTPRLRFIVLLISAGGFGIHATETRINAPFLGAGNTNSVAPFAFEQIGATSVRFQQVYSADEFRNEIPQGGTISGLYFVADSPQGEGFSTAWERVEIDFSVTARGPDSLSPVFMENSGANLVTVRDGFMQLGAAGVQGERLLPTSRIELETPYLYNPADGNLLMEIRIYGPSHLPPGPGARALPMWASDNLFGVDTVSRVFAYDVNATSGIADSIGLVTHFAVTPVPEPSVLALGVLGMCLLVLWAKRRESYHPVE